MLTVFTKKLIVAANGGLRLKITYLLKLILRFSNDNTDYLPKRQSDII